MIIRQYIRRTQSLRALGYKYVNRALGGIPGTLSARIVIQPSILPFPELKRFRILVEKDDSSEQHYYETEWSGDARIGSTPYVLNLQIRTGYIINALEPQDMISEAPRQGPDQESEYERLSRNHPDFRAHHRIYKSMLLAAHENLRSIAVQSCMLAFEAPESDSQLQSAFCQVWSGSDERSESTRSNETNDWHGKNPRNSGPGYVISMNRQGFEGLRSATEEKPSKISDLRRAYVALGSNVGDRITMIEAACQAMGLRGMSITRTSALYETEPMYLKAQKSFINGIETSLSPKNLLAELKAIESYLGRVKTIEKGPRNIDLDIILYGNEIVELDNLSIPHKGIRERDFVLRPICDIIPDAKIPSRESKPTFRELLDTLPRSTSPLFPLTPLGTSLLSILSDDPKRSTHLMAILNLTPDSFSDGGDHSADPSTFIPTLQSFVDAGVSVLDIGGQSTRPHAPEVSPEEELRRVLPTIKLIRSQAAFSKVAISIDTYRASVAIAAIEEGANIINDVSAGQMDPEMLTTMAKLGCTVVLMHMRGTPDTMNKQTSYPSGIIEGVGTELRARVAEAEAAGIRRWRIMLDPGIGFAKNESQNLELLRRFGELRGFEGLKGFPWVVGASRKGFIGRITGVKEASQRAWGTAAAVNAAVQGGADIVRVHDVKEMGQVVKMADAIWRV